MTLGEKLNGNIGRAGVAALRAGTPALLYLIYQAIQTLTQRIDQLILMLASRGGSP